MADTVPRGTVLNFLYCTILFCGVLYDNVLHFTVTYCLALYLAALYCTVGTGGSGWFPPQGVSPTSLSRTTFQEIKHIYIFYWHHPLTLLFDEGLVEQLPEVGIYKRKDFKKKRKKNTLRPRKKKEKELSTKKKVRFKKKKENTISTKIKK